ncbi:unnamed protein product [Brassica oleracea]|uniref:Defensin-like domain-containing protein n=1 Tax=Brassica oleracea TaxID=3712 RepID=A0A3P6GXE4_BRAOL|nr:unnamed protein product [Brassica oleracea]
MDIKLNLRNIKNLFGKKLSIFFLKVYMGSFRLMVTFTLVAMAVISCDLFNVETGIFVQAAGPICGQVCSEKFEDEKCYKYCVGLSYKNGFCFQSDPKTSTLHCCCANE